MKTERIYRVMKPALIAGLAGGLVMGLFHYFLSEPFIRIAIDLEEKAANVYEPTIVSRSIQEPMLVVGSAIYGLLVGAIVAIVFAILGSRIPGRRPDVKAAILTGVLWWSEALLPFLKYPANPPGVGDPATVYFRQNIQIGFMVLSAIIIIATWVVYWFLGRWWRTPQLRRWRPVATLLFYGVMASLLFVLTPDNPDAITAPAKLVWDFRILSMFGQVIFWATLGGVLALLLKRVQKEQMPGQAISLNRTET